VYHQKNPGIDGKLKSLAIVPSAQLMSSLLEAVADVSFFFPLPLLLSPSYLMLIMLQIVKIQPHISSAIFVCPEDLLSYSLTPLVNEVINMYPFSPSLAFLPLLFDQFTRYQFLNTHLSSANPVTSPPPPAQFSSSFNSQLSDLKQFFNFLHQALPTLSSLISFPSIVVPVSAN
jgi:hypothetical protein